MSALPPLDVKRLKRFPVLSSLNDDELAAWLPRFGQELRPRNELVYREGEPAARFYLVEMGQVAAYKRGDQGGDEFLGYYGPGDCFGELEIFENAVRWQTLKVTAQTNMFFLPAVDFLRLCDDYPKVRAELQADMRRREQRQLARFHGRRPDEAVIIFSHRHWIRVVVPWSLLSFAFAVFILLAVAFVNLIPGFVTAIVFALYLFGLGYYFFDYRDDWFIVTSKRVIRREATFEFLNESQDEAPVETVQNVSTRVSSLLENFLNYGDVVIQTAGGKILFDGVPHPSLTRDAILDEVQRVREHRRLDELSDIRKALQNRFTTGPDLPPPPKPPVVIRPPSFGRRFTSLFAGIQLIPPTRLSKDGQIIWRKHWIVLYTDVFPPLLGLLILIPFTLYLIFSDVLGVRVPLGVPLLLAAIGGPILLVLLFYRYRDWENDIYVLTNDQLIDSERKPFWLEEKVKVLGLGQIQNVRFERTNLLNNILNFGQVVVQTAGQDNGLTFENIPNPREVEERILEGLERFKERQRDRERMQRRREFLDWFGEYHRMQQIEKSPPPAQP